MNVALSRSTKTLFLSTSQLQSIRLYLKEKVHSRFIHEENMEKSSALENLRISKIRFNEKLNDFFIVSPSLLLMTIYSSLETIDKNPILYPYARLGILFPKSKDSIPHLSRSSVYLLRCRNCPASYVGETRRAFRTRIDDHKIICLL